MKRYSKIKEINNELENSLIKLDKLGYKIDRDDDNVNITNKKGFDLYIIKNGNEYFAMVPGYKDDIDLGEISVKFQELKKLVDGINKTWMKQNDPYGDRW
jgi:hypothetical protein